MVIAIIVSCVLAIVFMGVRVTLAEKSTTGGVIAMFVKTLASVGFIAVGVTAICLGVENIKAAMFVICGLVFGLIGDMVLDLKVVYLKQPEEDVYLTGGMVSFGLGHVMYLVAICLLLGKTVSLPLVGICVAVAAVVACAMVFGGEKFMGFKFGKFVIHSILYAFCLIFMSALGVGLCISMKSTRMLTFAIGMILFLLSDVVLTSMYFGGRAKDKTLCIINHALYYAAQICIASFIATM